jgi:hypothetical protein
LGIFGDFWEDGTDAAQKVDTLADRRVSSTPGKRQSHDPPLPTIQGIVHLQGGWNGSKPGLIAACWGSSITLFTTTYYQNNGTSVAHQTTDT